MTKRTNRTGLLIDMPESHWRARYNRAMQRECDICGATEPPFHPVEFERDGETTQGIVCAPCHEALAAFNADPAEIARTVGYARRVPLPPESLKEHRSARRGEQG